MKIIGVDPGTAACGYGVIEETRSKISMVGFGCISSAAKRPLVERLEKIYIEITELIKKEKPDAVAVEELFFAANTTTAISVGHARGVVLLACAQAKVPVFEYTPLEVKQAVCGYGRGEKKQIQKMVKVLLGLKEIPKPDDAADGLAIAICHANTNQFK